MLRTNAMKSRIENQDELAKCRTCGYHDETASCSKLVQVKYKNIDESRTGCSLGVMNKV